jgi:S-formylglutathione hydrolase FrmB
MEAPWATYMEMIPLRKSLRERPMIVVTFDGDKAGWYIDATHKKDNQFTTFFFDELVPFIDAHCRTHADPARRAVTGFSMGGYGAFHYMLTHPDRIGSVSALSGAFTFAEPNSQRRMDSLTPLLGPYPDNKPAYDRNEILPRIDALLANGITLPPMFIHCGTEDWLVGSGRRLLAFLLAHNESLAIAGKTPLNFQYRESPGGHNWPFWRDASEAIAEFHWRHFHAAGIAATPAK